MAGNVGSSLGLYPYSSTSFLRISSASLRCFRLLQKNKAARTRSATPTIGTITSTAVLPPPLRPPLDVLFPVSDNPGVDDEAELDEVCKELASGAEVNVRTTVVTGCRGPPLVTVTTEGLGVCDWAAVD